MDSLAFEEGEIEQHLQTVSAADGFRLFDFVDGEDAIGTGLGFGPVEHDLVIDGVNVGKARVDGQYAVVPVRLYQNRPLVGAVGQFGQLPLVAQAEEPPAPVVAPPAPKPVAKPAARPRPAAKPSSAKAAAAAL